MKGIVLEHLSKIEGHARLVVELERKRVKRVRFDVFESSRLFEQVLVGRSYEQVLQIVQRICGVCGFVHLLNAIKALEEAFGIEPSEQSIKLRKLFLATGIIQSHVTHLYFMSLPDYLGYDDVVQMARKRRREVRDALRFQELAMDALALLGGRAVHQIAIGIGDFKRLPTQVRLEGLLNRFKAMKSLALSTARLFSSLSFPEFRSPTSYLALSDGRSYALYEGKVKSTDGMAFQPRFYKRHLRELRKDYTNAKHCLLEGRRFMVGALARLTINHRYLCDEAKEFAIKPQNPFLNNLAQAIELVQLTHDSIRILDELLESGIKMEGTKVRVRAGKGIAVTEAPRGTLFHEYTTNRSGFVVDANIITPTAQNLENLENDLRRFLPSVLGLRRDELVLELEKLIRAYDPCISCATHFLELELKGL
jgi:coenzyme F420-reducing hydrogenase alpha subunit